MPKLPPPDPADPLRNLPISDGLRALAQRGEIRRFAKNAVLIQEGDFGDTLYLVVSGRVRAYAEDPATERQITYGLYGPGEYVGEMGLDGGRRAASVETVEASRCVVITRQTLLTHIAEHPDFALELLAKVIRRARAATMSARQMALNDVYGRVKAVLESMAAAPGPDGARVLCDKPTHLELSQQVGSSREMVSRVMKDLRGGNYLSDTDPRGWVLLKPLPARW